MIIDFHTHIYPDHLAARTLSAVRKRAGIRSHTDGTLKGLLGSMEAAGIDISVMHSVATRPEQVDYIHDWLPGIRQPGIHATAATHPDTGADPDRMRSLKAEGFRGFKVHPDSQEFFVDDRRMYPFYEAARDLGLFILFHAGVDRGLPDPVHATPEGLAKVHRAFPGLVIIAAHMGGESMYRDTERYLLGQDIYLDTSFVLSTMPVDLIKRFMDRHPVERFLFGSDTPWRDQAGELAFFLSLPFIGEEAKEMITYRNAAGLLDL
jgi:predicted TIM-barrel fold metal-dependent hydrolase